MPADWTTEAEKHALVERSGKLFIFAATCIRFIGDDRVLAPREHLALILGSQPLESVDLSEVTPYKELDVLYMRLLRQSLSDSNPRLIQNRFQIVVGSIVLLWQPLPLRSLAVFIENSVGTVSNVLRHLQSVIIPPYDENEAPRIYHPSFVDFITNPSRCSMEGFLITAVPVQEQRHTLRCFRLMEMCLKRDVAGIEDPSLLNSKVDGFEAKVASALPAEAQYACRFWGSHLSRVEIGDEKVMGALEEFAMRSILWWIEAMSLLGSIHTVASSVREAHRWAVSSKCKAILVTLLADARRFILAHAEVIRASALHVYHSALPFTPHDTALYKVYCKETRHSIRVLQEIDHQWPHILANFTGHSDRISSIACSKDGLQLASGSWDKSIKLWDITSGLLTATLEGHTKSVKSVAFSPDGNRLASGSSDSSIRLWDATSGIPIGVLKGHLGAVQSVAYSPDGSRLASASFDHSVRLWDAISGVLCTILEGHTGRVYSVAFSPDGSQLASGSSDSSIWLWDAMLGTPITILGGSTGCIHCIVFSPDGLQLAASDDISVQLWDSTSGPPIVLLRGDTVSACSVAFSLDGMQLACSRDGLIQIWDATSGTPVTILRHDVRACQGLPLTLVHSGSLQSLSTHLQLQSSSPLISFTQVHFASA
ncbi:hypothetical protein BS47DRAFT_1330217 [Hydnum rufescens UP504]|uniref:Vegetative incompatibility protein HET-E-1 n=1 Tax=Hydnum rufescens UP504 TaxID=1448309 RepID=A0A9P6AVH6_9AGAM|nr:hypothetical protein BS47DRAFT_1330217 [Hydnum rufescens UP504]